uniref:Putative secreted protein n=1 Tax=Anopheles triannulatus TaxID=58253 RepID=A0A2M4B4H3_9DIPT
MPYHLLFLALSIKCVAPIIIYKKNLPSTTNTDNRPRFATVWYANASKGFLSQKGTKSHSHTYGKRFAIHSLYGYTPITSRGEVA